jgi:hypothetical protein
LAKSGTFGIVAISQAARSDLYTGLVEVLGSRRAETLMSAIPLHDLDEVATKRDLQVFKAELRVEISELRLDLSSEIDSLRKTMTNWMLTQSVAIIGAIVGVALFT